MKRVFMDTNVLLDFMCNRQGFAHDAIQIVGMAVRREIQLYVSALTMVNVKYIARKYNYRNEEIDASIMRLLEYVRVSPITESMIAESYSSGAPDTEDMIQSLSGKSIGASCVITRDPKGFGLATVPVLSPKEFLESCR